MARIAALIAAAMLLTGCTHVRPWRVAPTPTMHSYDPFSCEELDTEARRIEKLIAASSHSYQHGTREKLSVLRGQADAVNEQIVRKACHVPPVNLLITRKKRAQPKPTAVYY